VLPDARPEIPAEPDVPPGSGVELLDVPPLGVVALLEVPPPGVIVLVEVPPAPLALVDTEPDVSTLPEVAPPAAEPEAPARMPPLALPPVPTPELVVPPGEALGLPIDCASRLHASKSVWVGSAAKAAPHTATMAVTVRSAVAHFIVLMLLDLLRIVPGMFERLR